MIFSQLEKRAILTLVNAMINADGRVDANEIVASFTWLSAVGFSEKDMILDSLEASQATTIIANMSQNEKKVVTSILITIMISDNEIDEKERAVINLITTICRLPEMNSYDVKKTIQDLENHVI